MTELQERLGAVITHAEILQKTVEAALAKMEAQGLAQQKAVAQLLVGVEERARAIGAQEQRLAQQVSVLSAQTERLAPAAFAGGQAAVRQEVRDALSDAASVAGSAARETIGPVREALAAGAAALSTAEASLLRAQRGFSWRAFAFIGATALGALSLAAAGGYAMIGWQRVEIANAREELTRLQARSEDLASTVVFLEKKSRDLDAKGVRFETTQCLVDKAGKTTRLCVEIDPAAPNYMADDGRRQFRVPKGF